MVSVSQTGQPLTLATLISERCRDLRLSQAEFVSRVGCQNIQKGIWLLHQLFDGDHTRTEALVAAISAALDLPDNVVYRAAQVSQQLMEDRKRRRFEIEETTLRADKSAGSIVPYLRLISGWQFRWPIRFGDLELEIDLWGVFSDLTAIALRRCRNAGLKLRTKLQNYVKKIGGYVNS
jgi:hypothetical protein